MRFLRSISLSCDPQLFSPLLLAFLCAAALAHAQVPTTTTLAISANGSPVTSISSQTALTLTATVTSSGSMVMPGQVEFCDAAPPNCTGAHVLNVAQITRAGTAVMKYIPGPGAYTYQAVFLGTNLYTSSSSTPVMLTVGVLDPTSITSGGGPGNYSLDASIAGGGKAFPTGTVSFLDTSNANYVLGTATLMPGLGSFGGQLLKTAYASQVIPNNDVSGCVIGLATGDFNGDGKLDLAVGDIAINVLLGLGNALFTSATPYEPVAGSWACSIAVGDFNQDGKLDFVMTQMGSGSAVYGYVLLGNGDGTFTEPQVIPLTGQPYVQTGDFNGDGVEDIVFSAGTTVAAGATVMLGNGDGTFSTSTIAPPTGLSVPPVTGDFTGDGFIDTATAFTITAGSGDPEILSEVLQTIPPDETSFSMGISGIFIVGTGNHLIAASYSGDNNYPPSISAAIPLMALPEPTTLGLTANPAGFNQFQPTTLTATLAPDLAQNHNATGTVTFMSGTTVVGTGSIVNGVARLTTTNLPGGMDNVIAVYMGDTNFAASSASAITVPVTPVDFTMSLASPSLTIETQHHLTTSIAFTSINGFTDSLAISCIKPPKNITCQFMPSPAMLAGNGTATVSFYLDTDSIEGFAQNNVPLRSRPVGTPVGIAFSVFAGVAAFGRCRTRLRLMLLVWVAVSMTVGLSGCGEIIIPPPSVLPGTYTIPVTATAAVTGVTHTAQLTLTVTR
jgi:Bacterial Ig-like domain (group 3)/FG-GAP-like repeat